MKVKWNQFLAVSIAAAMLFGLAACDSSEPEEKPELPPTQQVTLPEPKPSQPTTPEQPAEPTIPDEMDESLALIYDELEELQYPCAVMYLGYTEGPLGDGYTGWFEETDKLELYPFLADIPSERIIEQDGGEVYCIIPRKEGASISVYAQNFDYDGNVAQGDELFRSMDSEPFLVRGNISEIVPNTIVNIQYEDGSGIEFSPCLSGENGHLSVADDQLILDLSQYDDAPLWYLGEEDLEGQWLATDVYFSETITLTCYLEFSEDENSANKLLYWYGHPDGEIIEQFEGHYYESDIPSDPPEILFEMKLTGGTMLEEMEPYDFRGSFQIAYWSHGDIIEIINLDGNPLVSGFEEGSIVFERTYG